MRFVQSCEVNGVKYCLERGGNLLVGDKVIPIHQNEPLGLVLLEGVEYPHLVTREKSGRYHVWRVHVDELTSEFAPTVVSRVIRAADLTKEKVARPTATDLLGMLFGL